MTAPRPPLIAATDLSAFADIAEAKAKEMCEDAIALAGLSAPCLDAADLDPKKAREAKAILRGAVLRWNEAGQGGRTQVSETTGPHQYTETFDAPSPRRHLLWPSEIADLQKICAKGGTRAAWSYDTAGGSGMRHADTCAINLGATFCDCGTIYNGGDGPLWDTDE